MKTECNHLGNQGFEGTDVCLSISLFEYGLIWKQFKRKSKRFHKGDWLFYYGTEEIENDGTFTNYDWCSFSENTDIKDEFNWADFKAVSSFIGQDIFELDFPHQIQALYSYYGRMEIFGAYN